MRIIAVILLFPLLMAGSCEKENQPVSSDPNPYFRLMFYNTENLFDTEDDPETDDAEFLPGSSRGWTDGRYQSKLDKIAKVIQELGGDALPSLIGFCEVENRRTLDDLTGQTSLKNAGYQIVHQESPDSRGIDVALLYRSRDFILISSRFIPVVFPFDPDVRTRDILYAKGILGNLDTLHVFVGHWPSRSGGEMESRPRRVHVASMIRKEVDSIFAGFPLSKIIITGDFNDEPSDYSVIGGLKAQLSFERVMPESLYDLTVTLKNRKPGGTYKYRGTWNLLDHFVVSGSLLDTTGSVYTRPSEIYVFQPSYLLEPDETNLGLQPKRTYLGPVYHGGYSDHLPIYLDLKYQR